MSNPAVVILTDPARCQLAEADTLMQALLQVQQLSEAGVAASQAFCDHPAAAMGFIEAYSKAYPALQLHTSDLPLPQHLYSMVTDGRLSPLPPAITAETAKLDQAGQHHPLYVLSLGAPETLMQALQHSNLAKSSIHVLEIAPIEQVRAGPVLVAEAVAAAPLARSPWLAESSSAPKRDSGDPSGTEPLTENPVELSSVEVDLDRIQVDTFRNRQAHDQNDRIHHEPMPAVIANGAPSPGPSPSDFGRQTAAEGPASSIDSSDAPRPPAASATPASAPVSDTPAASPTDLSSPSIIQSDVPPVVVEAPSDDSAETPEQAAREDIEPSLPTIGNPGEQDPATDGDGLMRSAPGPARDEPEVEDAAAVSTREGHDEGAPAGDRCVFDMPGEDVLYQPTAMFSGNDDLAYPLPEEDAGEPSSYAQFFDLSESSEVIDLEAVYRDLSEPAAEVGAALEEFDSILMQASTSDRADPTDAPAAYSKGERSATQRTSEPDEDEALNNPLTTVHDADV